MKTILIFIIFCSLLFGGCQQNPNTQDVKKAETTASSTYTPAQTASPTPNATTPNATTPKPPQSKLLASAKTKILDKGKNRLNNIYTAADAVNGYVVKPNEMFSFNEVVGKRTQANGYEKAPVIVEGEKEMDHGGGVCQMSTTIYQAVKKAGMKIKERHNHDKNVGYAKKGEDAAVDYGNLDFKFVNNTDFAIKIVIVLNENQVKAEIYQIKET